MVSGGVDSSTPLLQGGSGRVRSLSSYLHLRAETREGDPLLGEYMPPSRAFSQHNRSFFRKDSFRGLCAYRPGRRDSQGFRDGAQITRPSRRRSFRTETPFFFPLRSPIRRASVATPCSTARTVPTGGCIPTAGRSSFRLSRRRRDSRLITNASS